VLRFRCRAANAAIRGQGLHRTFKQGGGLVGQVHIEIALPLADLGHKTDFRDRRFVTKQTGLL